MIKIIPAIDIIEGKCVRLTKGDYSTEKVYSENPVEIAKSYEDIGEFRKNVS
jgi:phosphoribosylformimino-5-aminoimidazole carboxamide ribotide isomerase